VAGASHVVVKQERDVSPSPFPNMAFITGVIDGPESEDEIMELEVCLYIFSWFNRTLCNLQEPAMIQSEPMTIDIVSSEAPPPTTSDMLRPSSDVSRLPLSNVSYGAEDAAPSFSAQSESMQKMFAEGVTDDADIRAGSSSADADDELEEGEPTLDMLIQRGDVLRDGLVSMLEELNSWSRLVRNYKKSKNVPT
jgi:hypothetical protein